MVEQVQTVGDHTDALLATSLLATKRICYALHKACTTKTLLQGMIYSFEKMAAPVAHHSRP